MLLWKHFRILKLGPKVESKLFSSLLSMSLVGFLHVIPSYWTEKSRPTYTCHWRGLRNNFQNHRRVPEQVLLAQAGFWMQQQAIWRGLLEGLLKLGSFFKEASKNSAFDFLAIKTKPNLKTTSCTESRYLFNFIGHQKNLKNEYLSRDTVPLNERILLFTARGLQRDFVHLGWPLAPLYMSPNALGGGGGRGCGVSANEYVRYSCTQEPK